MDNLSEREKAKKNFPLKFGFPPEEFVQSLFEVKLASIRTNFKLGFIEKDVYFAMEEVIREGIEGGLNNFFDLTMIQGGAGTSLNMIANEVIAILTGEKIGKKISPFDEVNLHQSTNDVIPTAVKITLMKLTNKTENAVLRLLSTLEKKEKEFDNLVKPGLTQMQFAVPITLGREFSAYCCAISRDRWRVFKVTERLKEVNIGGTAIGTGFKAPRRYIFGVIEELRKITGLPLARADNIVDATQNADVFVEVSGILTALAADLYKIAGDLRFLSSSHVNQIILKEVQTGSSIMPGKVNPVIPEFVQSCAIKVQANHNIVQTACSSGNLELNPFLPLIAHALFEDFYLLIESLDRLCYCIETLEANKDVFKNLKYNDSVVLYALSTIIGYERAKDIFEQAKKEGKSIYLYVLDKKLVEREKLEEALTPENLLKLGF